MSDWHYQIMGQVVGPISSAELKQKAAAGVIQPDTLIRKASGGNWVPAAQANGLFSASATISPPSPIAVAPAIVPAVMPPQPFVLPERFSVVIKGVDIGIMQLATLQFRLVIAAVPALLALVGVVIIPYLIVAYFVFR